MYSLFLTFTVRPPLGVHRGIVLIVHAGFKGITADITVIWRLYIIWGRKRMVVIVPVTLFTIETSTWSLSPSFVFHLSLLAVVGLVVTIASLCGVSSVGPHHAQLVDGNIIAGGCAVIVNVWSTSLIVLRLWQVIRIGPRSTLRDVIKAVFVVQQVG